jgi:hypothetical protein
LRQKYWRIKTAHINTENIHKYLQQQKLSKTYCKKSSNIGTCLKYLHMHKILALAQNVGGLSKYRRQMYAANVWGKCLRQMLASNVGVKCWRTFEIYAANVAVQSMRNCEITAPHNIQQRQGGQ